MNRPGAAGSSGALSVFLCTAPRTRTRRRPSFLSKALLMHILLTGSTGFIGHTVAAALTRAGHTVHGGVSPRQRTAQPLQIPMDFARDTTPDAWLPRLAGIDAVVNAVGAPRDRSARPLGPAPHPPPPA